MGRVRQEAEQAGLRVTATTIEDPGAGPGKPPMLASDSSSESVRQVREAEVAYRRHQQKAEAYRAAQKKVEEIFGDLRLGQTKYLSDLNTARAKAAFTVAGVVYPLSKDIKQRIIDNKYDKWQKKLKGRYERAGESARKAAEKPGVGPAFRDLHERAAASDKVKFAKAGDEIAKIPAKYTPIRSFTSAVKAGAPFAAAGTVADIANGKDPKKAVLSGGTNLLASAATGALAGSVLGPPGSVAGAVVGSLVGVAAGSFASGAVESLYDHQDLGRAGKDGMKAVVQTGKDIAELTSAAAGGVGSLISKIRR
ncbi:DUF456 domain-containing protein [Austwickia chelonae]|uniref:DUF456 domain-containing protein n=1 Tax=Austwickia chelonae TaxID=100225 RepID=UPI0013C3671E|nr:DUF456 domain-containing protein [Austwickia chelonae]